MYECVYVRIQVYIYMYDLYYHEDYKWIYIYLYVHSIVYIWYVYTCIHYLYKHIYTHNVKEKTQGCLKEKGKTQVYVILILI